MDSSLGNSIKSLFESVVKKLERNDRLGAISDLTKILELNPQLEQVYYFRGNEYSNLNMFNEAISDFEKLLCYNPYHNEALTNLGVNYRHAGQMKAAFHIYTKAIELFPENPLNWHNRGHIKRYLMDMKGAKDDFEHAFKLGDYDSQKWIQTCSMFNNSKSAEEVINEVPLDLNELIIEARKFEESNELQKAFGFISRAVDLYPDLSEPLNVKNTFERKYGFQYKQAR